MKINNETKIEKTSLFLVVSILLISFIGLTGAYGVASPYWVGHPIQAAPGDTKTVSITLQNVGTEGITIKASLKEGSEIASIREGNYFVPAGTIDTEILVTIIIPEDYNLEEIHKVTLSTQEVASGAGGGGVSLTTSFDTTFDVLILDIPKTEREGGVNLWTLIIVLIIVVLFILTITLKRRKTKKTGRKK